MIYNTFCVVKFMYKKKIKKTKFLTILSILLIFLPIFVLSSNVFIQGRIDDGNDLDALKPSVIRYEDIEIDDLPGSLTNWTWARTQPWCTQGSGTPGDPYVIEHETFTSSTGADPSLGIFNSIKHFIIRDCVILESYTAPGLYLDNVTNGQILNNDIFMNGYGIYLSGASYITISNNDIPGNSLQGIYLSGASYITISNNDIFMNGDGIYLWGADNITISDNTIHGDIVYMIGDTGIWVEDSSENIISNNDIYDNQEDGIYSTGNSDDNTITGNSINNNGWDGVYLESNSDNNLVYNNYFEDNGWTAEDYGSNNEWNSTTIGNYWDDYAGYDNDLDGIGDTPYTIFTNGQDNFPIWNVQERIDIDDSLTVNGTNWGNWTWAVSQPWCSGAGTPGSPYLIQNLEIDGKWSDCISIQNSNKDFIIRNCILYLGDSGIYMDNVTNGDIIENNCFDCGYGINYDISSNNNLLNNTIYDNDVGIYGFDSNYTTISNNIIFDSYEGIVISGGYYNTIDGNDVSYIMDWYGIELDNTHNNVINENVVTACDYGGIYLDPSHYNTISGNIIDGNYGTGIELSDCDNNIISGNTIRDNWENGISLFMASDNQIFDNEISYNEHGIVSGGSWWNNVSGNMIRDHHYGVGVICGFATTDLFYKNFFVRNGKHAFDQSGDNDWNSTTIGNYWDNYTGPDADHNGIGDVPYNISLSPLIQDHLPIVDAPPSITINSPSSGDVFGSTAPTFSLTVIDEYLALMWYTIDGGFNNHSFTENGQIDQIVWDAKADGPFTLIFYAVDEAGNIGSAEVDIAKDIQDPILIINSPNVDDSYQKAPPYSITAIDPNLDTLSYSLDGGNTTFPATIVGTIDKDEWNDQPNGPVTITFYARDIVGNEATEEVSVIKSVPSGLEPGVIITIVVASVVGGVGIAAVALYFIKKRK